MLSFYTVCFVVLSSNEWERVFKGMFRGTRGGSSWFVNNSLHKQVIRFYMICCSERHSICVWNSWSLLAFIGLIFGHAV